jgi:hypothetical protein
MELQKVTKPEPSKKMTVHIDVNSIILDTILKGINELTEKEKAVNKQIVRSTVVTRWALNLKLRKVQDKLQIQQLLYEELKKEYSKK